MNTAHAGSGLSPAYVRPGKLRRDRRSGKTAPQGWECLSQINHLTAFKSIISYLYNSNIVATRIDTPFNFWSKLVTGIA